MQMRVKGVALVLVGMAAGWALGSGRQDAVAHAQPQPMEAAGHPVVEYNLYLPPANPTAEKVVQKLDALGTQGWRLVGTTTSNGGTSGFIFARDKR